MVVIVVFVVVNMTVASSFGVFNVFFSGGVVRILRAYTTCRMVVCATVHCTRFIRRLYHGVGLFFRGNRGRVFHSNFFFLRRTQFGRARARCTLNYFAGDSVVLSDVFNVSYVFGFLFSLSFSVPFISV